MPFQSVKQRKWMWKNMPELAEAWTSKYGSKVKKRKRRKRTTKKER